MAVGERSLVTCEHDFAGPRDGHPNDSNGLERLADLTQWHKAGRIGLFPDRINKPPMASNGRMACWHHIVAQTVAIKE